MPIISVFMPLMHFLINTPNMGKWVDMFIETCDTREREREAWKSAHGGRRAPSYPKELAKYLALIDKEWTYHAMSKAKA